MFRAACLGAVVVSMCACGGGGDPRLPDPPSGFQYGRVRFIGTSATDFWAVNMDGTVAHSDGIAWAAPIAPKAPSFGSVALAGPKQLWVGGYQGLYRLSADGTTTDFSASVPVPQAGSFQIVGGHGAAVARASSGNSYAYYLFDGTTFVPMPPLPNGAFGIGIVGVWAQDNVLIEAAPAGAAPGTVTLFRWDGSKWSEVTAPAGMALTMFFSDVEAFPGNEVWLTGTSGQQLLYDGSTLQVNATPIPKVGSFGFGFEHGHPTVTFESGGGQADDSVSLACDTAGNCQNLDVPSQVTRQAFRMEWNGTTWTNRHVIATVSLCAGAGCAYHQVPFGVMGNLEDGTQIYGGVPDGEDLPAYWIDKPAP